MNKLNHIQHEALKRAQWSGNNTDGKGPFCPVCARYEDHGLGKHEERCVIGEALAAYESVERAVDVLVELTCPNDIVVKEKKG